MEWCLYGEDITTNYWNYPEKCSNFYSDDRNLSNIDGKMIFLKRIF
jgi:hypothetical protein